MVRKRKEKRYIFGRQLLVGYKYAIRRRDPGMQYAWYWCGTTSGKWTRSRWHGPKLFDTPEQAKRELKLLMKNRGLKYVSVVRYPIYEMTSAITMTARLYAGS